MKIFKDFVSGDEMFSDTYPIKVVDEVAYEVETKMVNKSTEENFDIGANPSQEGAEEEGGVDSQTVTINNLIDASRLQPTMFDKKAYMGYIKAYMKRMLDRLNTQEGFDAKAWQGKMQAFVKARILDKWDDFTGFYTGENMDADGMVALQFYKEDGIIPYFYFFKDGLIEEKV
eukprot:CAMPEP_0168551532 /NCGR_PEP_ID=MMETSP0413-20121227/6224_1 /TAXON_ID=136452 /ORGANISM="Filamoeba nolandi, Strain NC-AS-23-1" /LENGTH=172 /DNA_ID=CAMNT_0008582067 /DNA_START=79 /DNA_END=597 /DNA_ORIENTATION=+